MKIFLTGATGYIGGDALFLLSQQHPDAEFSLLVRSEDKAKKVQAQYPNARIVLGGLDDSKAIRQEAAWADIVIRMYWYPLMPGEGRSLHTLPGNSATAKS